MSRTEGHPRVRKGRGEGSTDCVGLPSTLSMRIRIAASSAEDSLRTATLMALLAPHRGSRYTRSHLAERPPESRQCQDDPTGVRSELPGQPSGPGQSRLDGP